MNDNTAAPDGASDDIREMSPWHVRTDGDTQARASTSVATINDYADAMRDGAQFPPIDVFQDGEDFWVADGHHRVLAARQAKRGALLCRVHVGTVRDALLFSVGSNKTHGRRRTNADKRNAVEILLTDPEWQKWSNRVIARMAGCSHAHVGNMRDELKRKGEHPERKYTVGSDGRKQAARKRGMVDRSDSRPRAITAPTPRALSVAGRRFGTFSDLQRDLRQWKRWALLLSPPASSRFPGIEGLPRHIHQGSCPVPSDIDRRDAACRACRLLAETDRDGGEE